MQYNVSVTTGANQGVAALMITLLDPSDYAVVFKPYYFNARMAIQMLGGGNTITYGPSHPETFYPDLDWLEKELQGPQKPKVVYLVNPGNPTGAVLLSKPFLSILFLREYTGHPRLTTFQQLLKTLIMK